MTQPYDITNSHGSTVTAVYPLQANGLDGISAPMEIVDIIFNHPDFNGRNVIVVAGDVHDIFVQRRAIVISNSAYAGEYVIDDQTSPPGAVTAVFQDGHTLIPVSTTAPVSASFNITDVKTGVNGYFALPDVLNGQFVFLPGTTFTVSGNSTSAANKSYTVLSAETAELYNIVSLDAGAQTITLSGDVKRFFSANSEIIVRNLINGVGDGVYVISSSVFTNSNTVLTIDTGASDNPLPGGVNRQANSRVGLNNPTTLVYANGIIGGTTASGIVSPGAPAALVTVAPTTVSSTGTPNLFNVIYKVAGDHTTQLITDTPIMIKQAMLDSDRITFVSRVVSATFSAPTLAYPQGVTQIATLLTTKTNVTPALVVDTTTRVVFPVTAYPYGAVQARSQQASTSIKLIGRGATAFNEDISWGQALQENDLHIMENFADATMPTAPLLGQLWFDTNAPQLRMLNAAPMRILDVNTNAKTFAFDSAIANFPAAVGDSLYVYNNTAYPFSNEFTIATLTETTTGGTTSGKTTTVGVIETVASSASTPLPSTLTPYGSGVTTKMLPGVVVTNMPAIDDVLVGGHQVKDVADPTADGDAVNLGFADARYVNVTGDTMTGALNMSNAGININNGTLTMLNASGMVFSSTGAGGISVQGSGSIGVDNGNLDVTKGIITVGAGTNRVQVRANGSAATSMVFTTSSATTTSGNVVIDLGSNKISNSSQPTTPTDLTTKQYVDDRVNGIIWISPIVDPNLFDDSLSTPPVVSAGDTLTTYHRTYFVKGAGTGAWTGLDGHAVWYDGTTWKSVLGRAVAVGDRFGVFIEPDDDDTLSAPTAGGVAGQAGKIATVTSISPSFAYTFYTPTEPDAVSVKGTPTGSSPHFGHSYTFRGTWGSGSYGTGYRWIEFSGPQMLVDGAGLRYTGNILNVGQGTGITIAADTVALDTTYTDGRYINTSGDTMTGALTLSADPTNPLHAATKQYADTFLSKSGGTMTGFIVLHADPASPLNPATKQYVDGFVSKSTSSTLSSNVNITFSGTGEVLGLPATPTTGGSAASKTYVDAQIIAAQYAQLNTQITDYTLVNGDANKTIYHPTTDNNPRTWTIPANASVAFQVGTRIVFDNDSASALTIAITTDTLVQVGTGTTGSRTIAANGRATATKVTATRWRIDGTGLS